MGRVVFDWAARSSVFRSPINSYGFRLHSSAGIVNCIQTTPKDQLEFSDNIFIHKLFTK
jgi:hypothetical protein